MPQLALWLLCCVVTVTSMLTFHLILASCAVTPACPQQPDVSELQQLLQPVAQHMMDASAAAENRRSQAFNQVKVVAEALQGLSWLAYTGPSCGEHTQLALVHLRPVPYVCFCSCLHPAVAVCVSDVCPAPSAACSTLGRCPSARSHCLVPSQVSNAFPASTDTNTSIKIRCVHLWC